MKRILTVVAVAALSLGTLTSCGGDKGAKASGDSYCGDLKAARAEIDALKGGDFSTLERTTATMHSLADEAPAAIKDDWTTLVGAVDKLVDLLKQAGLSDADMANLQSGTIPDGVDMASLQNLMTELQKLNTPDFQAASDRIRKDAKASCGVDLQA